MLGRNTESAQGPPPKISPLHPSDEPHNSAETLREQSTNDQHAEAEREELPIAIRKGNRTSVKPLPYSIVNYLNYEHTFPKYKTFLTVLNQETIPNTTAEALVILSGAKQWMMRWQY